MVGHLVAREIERGASPEEAVAAVLPRLQGAFAIAFLFRDHPDLVIGARMGAPLTVGYGDGENYLGSDALAVAPWTQRIAYLDEGDWAVIRREGIQIFDRGNQPVEREIVQSGASSGRVEKGNYRHFMQKEIFEQPIVVAQTLQSYVRPFEGHVALAGRRCRPRSPSAASPSSPAARAIMPGWSPNIGSSSSRGCRSISMSRREFRYREPVLEPGGLALFISQSGETADTLAALRHARSQGQRIAVVVNVPTSSMAREADLLLADPCRAGDRRRLDQGLHLPARGARGARVEPGARQGAPERDGGAGDRRATCRKRRRR